MATNGNGSGSYMPGELFKMMTGVDLVHVPYRGTGPAFIDLIAGQVQVMFGAMPATIEYIKAGKVRGAAGARDLALFSTAIDTMLRGCNLVTLVVGDVQNRNGSILPLIEVAQSKGAPPVRCALSKSTTMALEKWIAAAGLKRTEYLVPGGARRVSRPMNARQFSRLLKSWVVEAGFDPTGYSVESLRRTKALHILRGTGDLQTVRALLGHVQIESTARYLGLKTTADPIPAVPMTSSRV